MKKLFSAFLPLFVFAVPLLAQKPADAILKQIKSLKAEKTITVTPAGSSMKIMGTADTFDQKDSSRAGIQAMNFGMAVFYEGKALTLTPQTIEMTFWVLTKKPRFTADHEGVLIAGKENISLGYAGWSEKPASNMEYLNFKVPREALIKVVNASPSRIRLASAELTFTDSQITLLRNFLAVTDVP